MNLIMAPKIQPAIALKITFVSEVEYWPAKKNCSCLAFSHYFGSVLASNCFLELTTFASRAKIRFLVAEYYQMAMKKTSFKRPSRLDLVFEIAFQIAEFTLVALSVNSVVSLTNSSCLFDSNAQFKL